MIPGLYTAGSALSQRFKAQEVIAANLSGATTLGYHRGSTAFTGFGAELYNAQSSPTDGPRTTAGVQLKEGIWDFHAGPVKQTGGALDFALQGPGFFVLKTAQGDRLTRAGAFMLNSKSELVAPSGDHVMGSRGPITLPKGDITVGADGTIRVNGSAVDKLSVVAPADMRTMSSTGGGLFQASDSDPVKAVDKPEVMGGYLQQSNVNVPQEMVWMLENNRMAESMGKAMQTIDEMLARASQDLAG